MQRPNLLWLVSLQDGPRGERPGNRDRVGRVPRELRRAEPATGARVLGGAEGVPGASGGQPPTVTPASESLRSQGTACRGPVSAPRGTAPCGYVGAPGGQPPVGVPWGTATPPCEQVLQGHRPPTLTHVSPAGRPLRGAVQAAGRSSAREEPGAVGAGGRQCRPWACDPGAAPTLRPEGTKEATSPSQPGEGGAAEGPDPVQSSLRSGRPAGPAAPGAGVGRA